MIKKCVVCGNKSIPGLKKGIGLCQEHYNNLMFGTGYKRQEVVFKVFPLIQKAK